MNAVRTLGKHLVVGVVAVWGVFTAVFALFSVVVDDPESFGVDAAADLSVGELYRQLLWQTATLDWGVATGGDPDANTFAYHPGDAVLSTVLDAALRTALYVLPAIALGLAVAVALGLYAALHPDSRLASVSLGSAYLMYAVPTFWLGAIALSFTIDETLPYSALVFEHLLPILLVATTLLGGAVSYARAYALEFVSAEFVTLVEAKGANRLRIAWHVLRNAAIPVVSMLFTEAFAVLVLAVFVVEVVFAVEGIGLVVFGAANSGDVPVLLGCVLSIVVFGVLANALQDVSYGALDPRVGDAP